MTICTVVLVLIAGAACSGNDDGGGNSADTGTTSPPASTTMGPTFPDARTEVTGAFWDGKVAVAGGLTPAESTDRFDLFDVAGGTWSPGPTLPNHYDHSSLAELGGRLYIVGGYTGGLSNPTNEGFSLGPGESAWTREPARVSRRGRAAARAS